MNKRYKVVSLAVSLILSVGMLAGCVGSNAPAPSQSADSGSQAESADSGSEAEGGEAAVDSSQAEIVMKVAFNQPENHPQYKAMEAFGQAIFERTDGKYGIQIFPNELLGSQRDTVEQVQQGTIEMSIVAGSLMENFNPDYVVFNLPYVFNNKDHQMSIVNDSAIVGELYESTSEQGMIVLGAFHGGVRNVYTKSGLIETPEDLAGQKIRVMESDTNIRMMELMGGTGTPMAQGEVYTAIQSGVLDGGENNELIFSSLKHTEVAPYYSYTQHLLIPDYLIVDTGFWNGLDEETQQIFREELLKAVDLEVSFFDADVAAAVAEAEAAGAEFGYPDITIFQERVAPLTEEKLTTDATQEIYQKVRAAA